MRLTEEEAEEKECHMVIAEVRAKLESCVVPSMLCVPIADARGNPQLCRCSAAGGNLTPFSSATGRERKENRIKTT